MKHQKKWSSLIFNDKVYNQNLKLSCNLVGLNIFQAIHSLKSMWGANTTDVGPQMVVKSKGIPRLFQGNLGWWNIIIWPEDCLFWLWSYGKISSDLICAYPLDRLVLEMFWVKFALRTAFRMTPCKLWKLLRRSAREGQGKVSISGRYVPGLTMSKSPSTCKKVKSRSKWWQWCCSTKWCSSMCIHIHVLKNKSIFLTKMDPRNLP